jgi:hypothetical protein
MNPLERGTAGHQHPLEASHPDPAACYAYGKAPFFIGFKREKTQTFGNFP